MLKNKKGTIGVWLMRIYELIVLSFIALVVLGASSMFYEYHVDVRHAESIIMTKQIVDCVSPKGLIDLERMNDEEIAGILNYCKNKGTIKERFFIRMTIKDHEGREVKELVDGDDGALWVKDLFSKISPEATTKINEYRPGYSKEEFPIDYTSQEERNQGTLIMEVLVRNEA